MRTLLLLPVSLALACAGSAASSPDAEKKAPPPPVHPGPSWFEFRAEFLGMSGEQAKLRDGTIGDDGPPDQFWDEQLAVESAGLWRALCKECHGGGRRNVLEAKTIPAPHTGWGRSAGTFFGKEKPHKEVFQMIFHGAKPKPGPPSDQMPAWGDKLSREQIWGLVYFVEHESTRASDLRAK